MTPKTDLRQKLEQKVIDMSWDVNVSRSDYTWLSDQSLENFLHAWEDLVSYYANNADDAQIGVEVLHSYVTFTRMFRRILLDPASTIDQRSQAGELLISLEGYLEDIIREVVSYLQSGN